MLTAAWQRSEHLQQFQDATHEEIRHKFQRLDQQRIGHYEVPPLQAPSAAPTLEDIPGLISGICQRLLELIPKTESGSSTRS